MIHNKALLMMALLMMALLMIALLMMALQAIPYRSSTANANPNDMGTPFNQQGDCQNSLNSNNGGAAKERNDDT